MTRTELVFNIKQGFFLILGESDLEEWCRLHYPASERVATPS